MKPPLAITALLVCLSGAAALPASAGTAPFDPPRLTFPEAPADITGQGCATPAVPSSDRCMRR